MQAGKLKDRVSLQQQTTTQDDEGQPLQSWAEVAPLWADIRYQSGIEVINADSPASVSKVSIQIRKRPVTSEMRIVDAQGVIYKILAVLPDMQRRDRINLPCEVVR